MTITNKFNLPESLVKAVENDDYTPGEKVWMICLNSIEKVRLINFEFKAP